MPTRTSNRIPDVETVARAFHELSDEAFESIPFGGADCNCRNYARHVQQVIDLFYGDRIPEPDGLGAVVSNPFTGGVWVRSAHPALPWYDPETASPQQWSDPTCEDWFEWDELPGPLVTQTPGWTPPQQPLPPPPPRDLAEPTGVGAIVVDATGQEWLRLTDPIGQWMKIGKQRGQLAVWGDLPQPVRLRRQGWDL